MVVTALGSVRPHVRCVEKVSWTCTGRLQCRSMPIRCSMHSSSASLKCDFGVQACPHRPGALGRQEAAALRICAGARKAAGLGLARDIERDPSEFFLANLRLYAASLAECRRVPRVVAFDASFQRARALREVLRPRGRAQPGAQAPRLALQTDDRLGARPLILSVSVPALWT